MDTSFNREILELLTRPEPRLPRLQRWLLDTIWTEASFVAANRSPREYLLRGEQQVASRERVLSMAAESLAFELAAAIPEFDTVGRFLQEPSVAAVVFDGCSLREMPRLQALAREGGREVIAIGCGRAAIPSETDGFIADRLGLGLPLIPPSQLANRRELKARNVRCYYFQKHNEHYTIENTNGPLLMWMRFPDQRYTDSTATGESLFEANWDGLEIAWRRTVGALPPERKVLVTSDHGYIFLGAGLGDPALDGLDKPLEGKRFRFFDPGVKLPDSQPGLWVDKTRRLAVLSGRTHNRPQAPSAAQSVYRHGGLSLMEMLTPWLVLSPVR